MRLVAKRGLDSFAEFCAELKVENGERFRLWPFQRTLLAGYFAGVQQVCIIIPKKNGKSTLLAALAIYHLITTANAECVIVAASRDQAGLILRQARMFIRGNAALSRLVRISQRQILSNDDEGRIVVLASDEDTADGYIPTLAIVDELHRHKTADLFGVLKDGLGPREGQIITISTAASTQDSPLGQLRTAAHNLRTFTRKGKYNHATDDGFEFHEWCLDPRDNTENLKIVKQANPAPWNTIPVLSARKRDPIMTPARWLRFACGIWTEAEDPWLDPADWDDLGKPALRIEEKSKVILAVKLRGDVAAVVAVTIGKPKVSALAWIMPDPELAEVEDQVRELCGLWNVKAVLYDPRNFQRSAEMLAVEGLPMLEFPYSPERMDQASGTLQGVIEAGTLQHNGDPELRAHVLAGTWKEDGRGRRLVEDPHSHRPVEALIALAAAVHHAGAPKKERQVMIAWR